MKDSDRRELFFDTAESETLGMCGNSMRENREALQTPTLDGVGRSKKAKSRNVDVHVCRESDGLIVPTKRANKADAQMRWERSPQREGGRPRGTHHKRTRAGHRAGDASHRVCGAYGKRQKGIDGCGLRHSYPNERQAVP